MNCPSKNFGNDVNSGQHGKYALRRATKACGLQAESPSGDGGGEQCTAGPNNDIESCLESRKEGELRLRGGI